MTAMPLSTALAGSNILSTCFKRVKLIPLNKTSTNLLGSFLVLDMLKNNCSDEEIVRNTGLSIEVVQKIK